MTKAAEVVLSLGGPIVGDLVEFTSHRNLREGRKKGRIVSIEAGENPLRIEVHGEYELYYRRFSEVEVLLDEG